MRVIEVPAVSHTGKAELHDEAHGSVLEQPAPNSVQPAPPASSQNACHAVHWSAGSFVDAPVHAAASVRGAGSLTARAAPSSSRLACPMRAWRIKSTKPTTTVTVTVTVPITDY